MYDKTKKQSEVLTHSGFRTVASNLIEDNSAVVWGLDFQRAGSIQVVVLAAIAKSGSKRDLSVELVSVDNQNNRKLVSSTNFKTGQPNAQATTQAAVTLKVTAAGFYELKLRAPAATREKKATAIGDVYGVQLSGEAVPGAVVRTMLATFRRNSWPIPKFKKAERSPAGCNGSRN